MFDSGFKSCHSTELPLLGVFNDIPLSSEFGHRVALDLLDLTAFSILAHQILLSRLENWMGMKGVVLDCFR